MIALPQRRALLLHVAAFKPLPARVLDDLALVLKEEDYPAGATLLADGDVEDRLCLIAEGRAESWVASPSGPRPVALLGEGEVFGERALLEAGVTAPGTVTALTALRVLSLRPTAFQSLLARDPEAADAVEHVADAVDSARFVKQATAFMDLGPKELGWLVERLQRVTLAAGEALVEHGSQAGACYLLRSGQVQIVDDNDGQAATLRPGALLGEAALLAVTPHTVTIRALQPCELLALDRADLLQALRMDEKAAVQIVQLLQWRGCPSQAPGVEAYEHPLASGEVTAILKDERRGAYYRLSPQGWFLWQRLDGRHSLRDLSLDYLAQFKSFAPQAVAEELSRLLAAGFVEGPALRADARKALAHLTWRQRGLLLLRRAFDWQIAVHGVDCWLSAAYRLAVRWLYTRPALAVMGLVSVAGLAAFVAASARGTNGLTGTTGQPKLWWFLIPAYLLSIAFHEAGHAFTVKAFGREVPRIGIGWYWFTPVAFVDTSDMWLADRWPRMAVSLAGPWTNLVLAGMAGLGMMIVPTGALAAALWQFALDSYLVVLVNLNPLLEYDGYYVLIDWLDRPNFRQDALTWVRQNAAMIWKKRTLEGHGWAVAYSLGSGAYVALVTGLVALVSRAWLWEKLAVTVPLELASVISAAPPVAVALAGFAALWSGCRASTLARA